MRTEAVRSSHPQQAAVRMSDARSYDEWKAAALAHDERSGAAEWRQVDESRRYDYRVIRRRLEEVRQVQAGGRDPHGIAPAQQKCCSNPVEGVSALGEIERIALAAKRIGIEQSRL